MDSDFPADCNGYIGFEFSHTTIHIDKRVNDQITYKTFVAKCLKFGIISNTNELKFNLSILYPDFDFSDRALDECLNWKKENIGLYERLYDLLDDIPNNPFMGGIGETEVLKNLKGVSSKRINQAHRITYKLANKRVSILACSGHYN
jgi:toxin YoeB